MGLYALSVRPVNIGKLGLKNVEACRLSPGPEEFDKRFGPDSCPHNGQVPCVHDPVAVHVGGVTSGNFGVEKICHSAKVAHIHHPIAVDIRRINMVTEGDGMALAGEFISSRNPTQQHESGDDRSRQEYRDEELKVELLGHARQVQLSRPMASRLTQGSARWSINTAHIQSPTPSKLVIITSRQNFSYSLAVPMPGTHPSEGDHPPRGRHNALLANS